MESQKFEELEGVDQEPGYVPEEEPVVKEYEKLLLAEANREMYTQATTLITFGCFEQKEEPTVDFSQYTKIETEKKYKGLYTLYQNNETMELVFICPLVENNKGDLEEKTNMKPYAYDCIVIEKMDAETFQMVSKAAKNNIRSSVSVLVVFSWIVFFTTVALGLVLFLYWEIKYSMSYDWDVSLFSAIGQITTLLVGQSIALPLLVLMSIKYKKYKEQ